MLFRICVHLGDVIEKGDGAVYGNGVNMAARLQTLAAVGGITVSDAVQSAVPGKLGASFTDQGEQLVKNMPHALRVFADAGRTRWSPCCMWRDNGNFG